jgi:hypothetical protein
MSSHITTEDAKKQQLPGFDVYKYSHLLYHDDLNRDCGVVRLNVEAFKAFSDTVTIVQRHALAAEQAAVKQWLEQGGFRENIPYPWGAASLAMMEYVNYEHLKIASGFELHLKARLLAHNYILHEIDGKIPEYKTLARDQSERPIEKSELIAIHPYHFDGKQNYLPGLREGSLKFSRLTDKPRYRAALGLSEQQIDIIRDYRLLRNQVHFPGDILEASNIQAFPRPIIEFLTEFINSEIVAWSNDLIAKYELNYRPLAFFT